MSLHICYEVKIIYSSHHQDLTLSGQSTKHFIAPTYLSFKHKNHIELDDRLLQIVYVRDYGGARG